MYYFVLMEGTGNYNTIYTLIKMKDKLLGVLISSLNFVARESGSRIFI